MMLKIGSVLVLGLILAHFQSLALYVFEFEQEFSYKNRMTQQ